MITYVLFQVQVIIRDIYHGLFDYSVMGDTYIVPSNWASSLWVALIQVASGYFCFGSAKLACKILIQNFSFTFALSLVGPLTVNLLIVFCGMRNADPCEFRNTIPEYLFFDIPPGWYLYSIIQIIHTLYTLTKNAAVVCVHVSNTL